MGFCNIKTLLLTFFLVYSTYLVTYKCHEKSMLEHLTHPGSVDFKSHPFSSQQSQLCGVVNKGSDYVSPYIASIGDFIDHHVHSLESVKKYKVPAKVNGAKASYHKNVHPYVHKFWQYLELLEYHVAHQVNNVLGHIKTHFHGTVVPKANEAKDGLNNQFAAAKDKLGGHYQTVMKAASSHLESAKGVAESQYEDAKDAAASTIDAAKATAGKSYSSAKGAASGHYKAAKDAASSQYDAAKDAAGNKYGAAKDAAESVVDAARSKYEEIKSKVE